MEKARQSREELASFRQQQEAPVDSGDDDKPASPAARRTLKRRAAKQAERLELAAADNLTQLRLSCIHPQVGRLPCLLCISSAQQCSAVLSGSQGGCAASQPGKPLSAARCLSPAPSPAVPLHS